MSVTPKTTYSDSLKSLQAAYSEAASEYQQAELAGDREGARDAVLKLSHIRAMSEQLNRLASETMNPQAPQYREPVDKFGLTETEREVARNSFGPVKTGRDRFSDLSEEQKLELYAQQKAKLANMRATGKYRMPEAG